MKIFLSCGHNNALNLINDHGKWRLSLYRDQGAVSGENTEFQYSSKIVEQIMKKFPPENGTQYVLVPYKLNLQDRIAWINKNCVDGDMCIELHMDSLVVPEGQKKPEGCSTWFMSGSTWAEAKAKVFQMEYTRITGIKGRGVKGDLTNRNKRLAFVRDTKCLAFLLEMGFITNQTDKDNVWLKGAEGIASGLAMITPLK